MSVCNRDRENVRELNKNIEDRHLLPINCICDDVCTDDDVSPSRCD